MLHCHTTGAVEEDPAARDTTTKLRHSTMNDD